MVQLCCRRFNSAGPLLSTEQFKRQKETTGEGERREEKGRKEKRREVRRKEEKKRDRKEGEKESYSFF